MVLLLPTAEVVSAQSDLSGKVALVSGATGGLGRETARVLALRNCKVLLGARSLEKGNETKKQILAELGRDRAELIEVVVLDLSSLATVRQFVADFQKREDKRLSILVNNAGIYDFENRQVNADGIEQHFGVNHLATFLLTLNLLPHLRRTAQETGITSRIVTVASQAHAFVSQPIFENFNSESLDTMQTYGMSKLANILFANELNDRLIEDTNGSVISNSLHPGVIRTREGGFDDELFKDLNIKYVSIPEGAATQVFLAVDEEIKKGGLYYDECKPAETSAFGKDKQLGKQLWQLSEKLTGYNYSQAINASA